MNSLTGKPALTRTNGKIVGDDADAWLHANDPDHPRPYHKRRPVIPSDDSWLDGLVDAPARFYDKPCVYFIQREDGPVKIGYSRTAQGALHRLRDLQAASPEPLRVMRVVIATRHLERRLHLRFAAQRISGEWFAPDEVLARIAYLD